MAIRAIEELGRVVVIAIDDELTVSDAVRIQDLVRAWDLVRRVGPAPRVLVDVRGARTCPAHVLLMLFGIGPHGGPPLALVGLSAEGQRLLEICGLDPAIGAARSALEGPEELPNA